MSSPAISATSGPAGAAPAQGKVAACNVAATAAAERAPGFFQRPLPVQLILAAFFLVTLPLAAIINANAQSLLIPLYLCLFGTTHFVVTFTVYLRQDNLSHFTSSLGNRIRFFGIPIALFVAFYFIGVLRLVANFPVFGLAFGCIIRLTDFNHLSRQSFGVHQLFKARSGLRAPAQLKSMENWFFATLTALLYCTFLAGGRTPLFGTPVADAALVPLTLLRPAAYAILTVSAILFVTIVSRLVKAWRAAGRPPGIGETLSYLTFQTAGSALAVVSLPLYAAALAMHYVEYHVLMYPRCFHSKLDSTSPVDRWFARLRASKGRFYAVVIGVSIGVYALMATSINLMGIDARPDASRYLAFAAIFDGLFVFHYFVETLIWRFGDPFFRKEASLYFAPKT